MRRIDQSGGHVMAEFDLNKVQGNDRYIAGGAVALLVLSFLHWYTGSLSAGSTALGRIGGSVSVNLWDAPYGILKLALLLALAAGVLVLGRLMGFVDASKLPLGINVLTLLCSGGATLILVLRLLGAFHSQSFGGATATSHPGLGWYLGLLVSAAMTYFAYLNVTASGEAIPGLPGTPPPPPAP